MKEKGARAKCQRRNFDDMHYMGMYDNFGYLPK